MPGVRGQDSSKGVLGPVHEVGAGAAVNVQVHEAGEQVAAVEVDAGESGRPAPSGAADVADAVVEGEDLAVGEDGVGEDNRAVGEVEHAARSGAGAVPAEFTRPSAARRSP